MSQSWRSTEEDGDRDTNGAENGPSTDDVQIECWENGEWDLGVDIPGWYKSCEESNCVKSHHGLSRHEAARAPLVAHDAHDDKSRNKKSECVEAMEGGIGWQ